MIAEIQADGDNRLVIYVPGPVLRLNRITRQFWGRTAEMTHRTRTAVAAAVRRSDRTITTPVRIEAWEEYVIEEHRPDVGSCMPAAKAAIDGLADGLGWADDGPEYVALIVLSEPVRSAVDTGLLVVVESC